jgi:hypothetical protein
VDCGERPGTSLASCPSKLPGSRPSCGVWLSLVSRPPWASPQRKPTTRAAFNEAEPELFVRG